MKKTLLIVVAIMYAMTIQAQFKLGVKAGVNLSEASMSFKALEPDNLTGFQVGPIIEAIAPVLGLGIDIAALYSQQGFKIDCRSFRQNSLDVPLNLKYKFSLIVVGAYLSAGPYARFSLSNNLEDSWRTKSFGAGLNFGGGIELLEKFQIGVNYQLGLTDDYADLKWDEALEATEGRPRIWSITAAYFF
ncbi:PorT family protein [Bacteroidales bacterium OttesenSCG-928-J19]|nr:PorT family protein [Bacteroidales bacterium OttesenSCG-928-J19]